MPLVSQMQHPRSLDFENQQKAYLLRTKEKLPLKEVAKRVVNLQGEPSTEDTVRRSVARFSVNKGRSKYNYKNCGRTPWKVTPEIKKWLIKKLLALRNKIICTSTILQRELARERKIQISDSAIRKVLEEAGYHWLRRCDKRKYSKADREKRVKFCKKIMKMGKRLWEKLTT